MDAAARRAPLPDATRIQAPDGMNGVALHGGFIPYGATFLIFMEYARNAVSMSALMGQRVLYVFTHDSIGLGEDGPTHQPVEQLTALRATPNLHTWRPCDAVESAIAWKQAVKRESGPTALVFSRQTLPSQVANAEHVAGGRRQCAPQTRALDGAIEGGVVNHHEVGHQTRLERIEHEPVALKQHKPQALTLATGVQPLEGLQALVGGRCDERPVTEAR